MSKVALRVYNREIETMIEGGKLDEAVAHCQNILKTFPMHVETYKLLGKSFLEARRYTDAADIFQRTLMAVPDDFVAHVGMSIIRDDEGKLDDAIWHMERAFEDQPSNLAIQSELRRLYGRRDGIEPPKIRLSRDALANMYAQGGLYHQAIAEIRAVLALDPDRSDLQVMLARAYYRAGQKVEAAEVAANLLKNYAYCLDALRVLVDVLPEESQTENTQVYRQRLHLLDPYSSFVTGSVFGSDQVGDGSVTVDRLEYVAGAAPASLQPNWAATLGIKLGEEKPGEPIPPWVTPITDEKPPAAPKDIPEVALTPSSDENSIPDWMQSVGWKESSGNVPEAPPEKIVEKPAVPLEKGDMPDWLKSMEPQAISSESPGPEPMPPFPSSPEAGGVPEWLSGLGTIKAVDAQPESPISLPPESPKDTNIFPDWLKEMEPEGGLPSAQTIPQEKMGEPGRVDFAVPEQSVAPSPEILESPAPQASMPELGEDAPLPPIGEAKPLIIEDDTLGWLESLAAKQRVKEEELLIKPENRTGDIPAWLRPDGEQAPVQIPPEPSASLTETLPLEPFPLPGQDLVEATPETVEEISSVDAVVEPVQPQNVFQDDKPAWLAGAPAVEEITPPVEQEPQPTPPAEEIPSNDPSVVPPAPLNIVEDREAWLKDLAITEPELKAEGLPPLPGTRMEEIPPVEHADESSQPFSTEADTETWLQGLAQVDQHAEPEDSQPRSIGSTDESFPVALPEFWTYPSNN